MPSILVIIAPEALEQNRNKKAGMTIVFKELKSPRIERIPVVVFSMLHSENNQVLI
jgi:hypothetical protein